MKLVNPLNTYPKAFSFIVGMLIAGYIFNIDSGIIGIILMILGIYGVIADIYNYKNNQSKS